MPDMVGKLGLVACALLSVAGSTAEAQTRAVAPRTVPFTSVSGAVSYVQSTPGSSFSYATNPRATGSSSRGSTSVPISNCYTAGMVSCGASVTSSVTSIPGAYLPSASQKQPVYNVTVRNPSAVIPSSAATKTDAVSGCPLRISNGRYVCDLSKKW